MTPQESASIPFYRDERVLNIIAQVVSTVLVVGFLIWAAITCPFFTFYAIISSMIEPPQTLGVFLTLTLTYGFTTAAMLIPAVYEFDVATGRATGGEE
jgi:hypothetical protein